MRILFLSNLYPPHVEGGAEILAGNIASGLERLGHEVFVLTSKEPERRWQRAKSPFTSAGAREAGNWENESVWHILEYTPPVHIDRRSSPWAQCKKLLNFYRRYHNAANAQKLRDMIAATSPDILYIWEITGIGVTSLLKVLPEFKIPIVFHLGSYWLLYARSPETEQSRLRIRWLKQLLIGPVPELTWTSMIAVSATVKQKYVQAGFNTKRIEVIYNGIDPRFLTFPRSACNDDKTYHLLYVGRIQVEKGVLIILKALKLLMHDLNGTTTVNETSGNAMLLCAQHLEEPPLRLHIIGDGDQAYVNELNTFVREKGLEEQVIFHGRIPQHELIKYYDHSQIMLVPSLWEEPFGLVIAEAMARGLPVIASNVGGPSEIITHGKNGLLVEAGDECALAVAISQLIQDPDKRQRFGEAARVTVEERFGIEESVNRVEQHLLRAIHYEIF